MRYNARERHTISNLFINSYTDDGSLGTAGEVRNLGRGRQRDGTSIRRALAGHQPAERSYAAGTVQLCTKWAAWWVGTPAPYPTATPHGERGDNIGGLVITTLERYGYATGNGSGNEGWSESMALRQRQLCHRAGTRP